MLEFSHQLGYVHKDYFTHSIHNLVRWTIVHASKMRELTEMQNQQVVDDCGNPGPILSLKLYNLDGLESWVTLVTFTLPWP